MTPFASKISAAKTAATRGSSAWQLALDKFPFNLDRSIPSLSRHDGRRGDQSNKGHRLVEVVDQYRRAKPDIEKVAQRQRQFLALLDSRFGERFFRLPLINTSRLLLHLGRSSVYENVGLYCERITGLPIIPGSAVKGMASTWSCWEANERREEFAEARSAYNPDAADIFGANPMADGTAQGSAGLIAFFGGFPQRAPNMELDIITPHPHEGRGRLTPSPFLAVGPGVVWDFVLISSTRCDAERSVLLLKKAGSWLGECLTQIGIGAKTASGFGVFRGLDPDEMQSDESRWQQLLDERSRAEILAQDLADASPEERAYIEFRNRVTDWISEARDVLTKPEPDRGFILRFFRSDDGKKVIKSWPNNQKAKQRIANLKSAGL